MKPLRDIVAAFSYFSILPVRHADEAPGDGAIAFLPLVGLIIGGLAGLGAYGVWLLSHSTLAAAIAAWVLSITFSGAIHVDGFLDCCDGLFTMALPQRRLEIMRDPHHGTYAIVGMAIASVAWLYALAQIPPVMMPAVLVGTGFLGRSTALTLRPRNAIPVIVYGVLMIVVIAALRGHSLGAFIAVILAALVSTCVGIFARGRLGGIINGDCYGAAIVVSEAALLLAYPALALLR